MEVMDGRLSSRWAHLFFQMAISGGDVYSIICSYSAGNDELLWSVVLRVSTIFTTTTSIKHFPSPQSIPRKRPFLELRFQPIMLLKESLTAWDLTPLGWFPGWRTATKLHGTVRLVGQRESEIRMIRSRRNSKIIDANIDRSHKCFSPKSLFEFQYWAVLSADQLELINSIEFPRCHSWLSHMISSHEVVNVNRRNTIIEPIISLSEASNKSLSVKFRCFKSVCKSRGKISGSAGSRLHWITSLEHMYCLKHQVHLRTRNADRRTQAVDCPQLVPHYPTSDNQ